MTEPTPFLMPLWKNERRPRPKSPRKTIRQNMSDVCEFGDVDQARLARFPLVAKESDRIGRPTPEPSAPSQFGPSPDWLRGFNAGTSLP